MTSHQFSAPGTYTVTLVVESVDGLTDSASMSVTALNNPPVAVGAIASPDQGVAPFAVDFSSAGSDDVDSGITFQWNFGDGSTSTEANPTHEYISAGSYTVTLTVYDAHNGSDTVNVGIVEVSVPAIVESFVSSESTTAGQLSGSYLNTRDLDGSVEVITERESGGRKNSRYSFAEHSWTINVPAGTSTVYITGYQDNSSDGDSFGLTYQMGGASGTVGTLSTASSLLTSGEFTHAAGQLTVSLNDSDQSSGNTPLDSAYIDQIFVRTLTDSSTPQDPPSAPATLVATTVSSSQINLNWDASSVDGEYGFRVERSEDSVNWSVVADLAADSSSHSDSGLTPSTTYEYRVIAFNAAGDSAASNSATATTDEQSSVTLTLSDSYKVKGANNVVLTWDDNTQSYSIYRDGVVIGSSASGTYTDSDLGKGGMVIEYLICNDSGVCSNAISVTF